MNFKVTPEFKDAVIALQDNRNFTVIKNFISENLNELRKSSDIISDEKEIHVSRGARQFAQGILDEIRNTEEAHRKAR